MGWYKITFQPDDVSAGLHSAMCNQYDSLFAVLAAPVDAVMYADMDPTVVRYYFSPSAAALAIGLIRLYGGVECSVPDRSSVTMVVGHSDAADIPFRNA
jgi:hypothetical protein